MQGLTPSAARARTNELAVAYGQLSPGVISVQIADHLSVVLANLRTRTMRPCDRAGLLEVAVDTAGMLGSAEFVGGQHDAAANHFDLAVDLAEESDQPGVIARACETASVTARPTYGRGDPYRALVLTERAYSLAGPGPVRIRAALDAAEAYAVLKNRQACVRMLTAADRHASTRRWGRGFFSSTDAEFSVYTLCGVQGRCLSLLGFHNQAVDAFNDALKRTGCRNVRLHSMWLADKAIALVRARRLDEACLTARDSLIEARTIGYERGIHRIRQLRTALPDTACSRELDRLLANNQPPVDN